MSKKIEYRDIAPNAETPLQSLDQYIKQSGLDPKLVELVRYRAAQVNGCPACLDMHFKALVGFGESFQRLNTLSAWRRTEFFSEREQAALAWTEVLTNVSEISADEKDRVFEVVLAKFNEKEVVDLTMAVIAINSWSRLHIAFGVTPAVSKETSGRLKAAG